MNDELNHDKKREAISSFRGYVYQAYQSVLAWMCLNKNDVLYLEGAEDFDIQEPETVTTTSVKDTAGSGSITLRSSDAVEAINNYWRHKNLNPDKSLRFRFMTTANPGQERGAIFGDVGKGIEYWTLLSKDHQVDITPIKNFLLELKIDETLANFLHSADDSTIRDQLICNFHWDTGKKPKDALIDDIKDRLVFHGHSKGVNFFHAEKALDTLLRKIADILCSKNDRRLTYADFCRSFDEATMEMIPRGEAAQLRSLATPAEASTKYYNLMQASRVLGESLPLVRGAVRREYLVLKLEAILRRNGAIILYGSTGLGKTSLARLLTDQIAVQWNWAGFRGMKPTQVADHLRRAAFEIKASSQKPFLVLDDVDLSTIARFEKEFLTLVFSAINSGGLVVVTSPTDCPASIMRKLWLSEESGQSVPYLNEEDIASLAMNHGLKDKQKLEQWSRIVWLTTNGGHPQLVHARICNLQSLGWPPMEEMNWARADDLEKERADSIQRLVDDIPSEGARTLAYRLSLTTAQFSRPLAIEIAQIPPSIQLAGEVFDSLVGPWIECIGKDNYRVSPLLQNEGTKVLSLEEARIVHNTIASWILKRKSVSQYAVSTALLHAIFAKAEQTLLTLAQRIISLDLDTLVKLGDALFWFPSVALAPGQHLCESNLLIDFPMRLAQYKIAACSRQGKEALVIIDKTVELLDHIKDEKLKSLSSITAYSIILCTIEIPIPPHRSIDLLTRLMEFGATESALNEIVRNFKVPSEGGLPLVGSSPYQVLFSFEVARINSLNDLDELLDALAELGNQKRAHLLHVFQDTEMNFAELLINNAWWREGSVDNLDVNKTITIMRKALHLGKKWQLPQLMQAAYIAISVMHDEYRQAAEASLAVLDEAEAELGSNNTGIINQRAKVLLRRNDNHAALGLFRRVVADDHFVGVEKVFACRSGGIAAARTGDWADAARMFLLGASEADHAVTLNQMGVGLLADAAFAHWKQGLRAEALSLYAEVLKALESIPLDQNLKNRHLHACVRHCLVWIDSDEKIRHSCDLIEPPPALCSSQEPNEGLKNLAIMELPATWGFLGSIDTKLGTGLGLMEVAEHRTSGKIPLNIRMAERIAKYQALWRSGGVAPAVPVIIGMIEGALWQQRTSASEEDGWQEGSVPALPANYWDEPNNRSQLLFTLLSLGVVATAEGPNLPLPTEKWRADIEMAGIRGSEVIRFLDIISGKYAADQSDLLETAAFALYRLRDTVVTPQELFRYHFRLINALILTAGKLFVGEPLADLISQQWLNVVEHQKFALQNPALYVPTIRERCLDASLLGFAKAAAILESAAIATGVPIDISARDFLNRIKSGEHL